MTASSSRSRRLALLLATLGVVGLGAVTLTILFLGNEIYATLTNVQQIKAYVLLLLPVGALLYGLLALTPRVELPKLLLAGALTGTIGLAIDYSSIPPEPAGSSGERSIAVPLVAVSGKRLEDGGGNLCRFGSRSSRNFHRGWPSS